MGKVRLHIINPKQCTHLVDSTLSTKAKGRYRRGVALLYTIIYYYILLYIIIYYYILLYIIKNYYILLYIIIYHDILLFMYIYYNKIEIDYILNIMLQNYIYIIVIIITITIVRMFDWYTYIPMCAYVVYNGTYTLYIYNIIY